MNLAELKVDTASYLNDPNFGYFTESQVTRFLNEAQQEVQKLLIQAGQNFYLRCAKTAVIPDACTIALPDNFAKVNRLVMITGGVAPNEDYSVLIPITLNQQDLVSNLSGTPTSYCLSKNSLRLFSTPDSTTNGYLLRMDYTYRVSDMALDGEVPDIPDAFQPLMPLLAAKRGFLRDDRPINDLSGEIQIYKDLMKQDIADRVQQTSRRVVRTTVGRGQYIS